jgi:hypothetical protein
VVGVCLIGLNYLRRISEIALSPEGLKDFSLVQAPGKFPSRKSSALKGRERQINGSSTRVAALDSFTLSALAQWVNAFPGARTPG